MRVLLPLVLALVLTTVTPAVSLAQSAGAIGAGTIEVVGATAVAANKQTITVTDTDGDLDLTNLSAGGGIHFYLSNRLSIGAAGAFTRLTFGVEDDELSATTMLGGPQVRFRMGSDRTALVLIGGGGLTKLRADLDNTDLGEADDDFVGGVLETTGWYWEAGADVSFMLRDNIAFNVGARYQATKSKVTDSDLEFDTAGISLGVGFSLFFGRK